MEGSCLKLPGVAPKLAGVASSAPPKLAGVASNAPPKREHSAPDIYLLRPIQSQRLTILGKPQLDHARTLFVIMGDSGKPKTSSVPSAVAERRPLLRTLMDPKSIALIGATEAPKSVGRTFMENLISSGRSIYPVNPNRSSVLGVKAFPKISDAPPSVDLAIIATPAATVPELVGE
jgi:hypothetical protein